MRIFGKLNFHMKKLLFFCLLLNHFSGFCQFDNFYSKFDGHVGYSMPMGKGYNLSGGLFISAEPKFWYNDEFVFGAKLGFNFLNYPQDDIKLRPVTNIVLVAEKYKWFQEGVDTGYFYGASAGLYSGGQISKTALGPTYAKAPKTIGLAPRAGIQYGAYRILAEYHMRKSDVKFITISIGYTW